MLAYAPVGLGDAEDILSPALSPCLQTLHAARALVLDGVLEPLLRGRGVKTPRCGCYGRFGQIAVRARVGT